MMSLTRFVGILVLGLACIAQPARADWLSEIAQLQQQFATGATVPRYSPETYGLAFHNYSLWTGSKLPEKLQLAHCTGMALLSRQAYLHASFQRSLGGDPGDDSRRARELLPTLFKMDARLGANDLIRLPFRGYHNLYELSDDAEMEQAIKDALGDAIKDATRKDWNWFPTDVLFWTKARRLKSDRTARINIINGRPTIFYLLDGVKEAHAVVAFSFEVRDGEVVYSLYDSNYPGETRYARLRQSDGKFVYPEGRARDPFILFE